MTTQLKPVRRSLFPQEGDTWESIAEREFPDEDTVGKVAELQSWNMHVFMRAQAPADSPRAGNPVLPSDVVFLEAPQAR